MQNSHPCTPETKLKKICAIKQIASRPRIELYKLCALLKLPLKQQQNEKKILKKNYIIQINSGRKLFFRFLSELQI